MNMKRKWIAAILSLTAGAGLMAGLSEPAEAQAALGCRLTPSAPRVVGNSVARHCADDSGRSSVKLVSTTGNFNTYELRLELLKAAAFSASVAIGGANGEPVLRERNGSLCTRSDGVVGGVVTFSCDIPVVDGQALTMRLVVGDGVGG
jgi:hypothetical protein